MTDPRAIFDDLSRKATEFTVTEDHLKLLRRTYVRWEDCEFGAPAFDCKRPYGNSDVIGDMVKILGIDAEADRVRWQRVTGTELDEGDISEPLAEHLTRLHAETAIVLQIALSSGEFMAGRYTREKYGAWKKADQ